MRKHPYLCIFLLISYLLCLTACGGGGDNWQEETVEQPKQQLQQPCKTDQLSPCKQ